MFKRMVKSMKWCLRKAIGIAKLTYDELLITLTEVEMILNFQLLSYISNDDLLPLTNPEEQAPKEPEIGCKLYFMMNCNQCLYIIVNYYDLV